MTAEPANVTSLGGASHMARLRAKRVEAAAAKTVDIPVAGYSGELTARYRLLDPLIEGKEIGDTVRKQFPGADRDQEREFYAVCDTLIAACDGLYLTGPDGPEPLDPDGRGPVAFEQRLAEGLGIDPGDPPTARAVLIGLFNGNKVALMAHGLEYQRWMTDPTAYTPLGEA